MAPSDRPAVSVVLPFHGTREDAEAALAALDGIVLRGGDEVMIADNTGRGVMPTRAGVRVLDAPREPSSYYARNEAAAAARNDWLLFVDDDCVPRPDVLDRYFDEPVGDTVGAIVGEVEGVEGQPGLVPRYARSRGHLGQEAHWRSSFRPWGVTANLLVRRAAWEAVGGFHEGIRSGGDTEFSWRLQDAGWTLDYRPRAVVAHEHRSSVRALVRQAGRYAAGRRWVMSRYPGALERPTVVGEALRAAAGIVVWTAARQPDRARFKALDGAYVAAAWSAFWLSNTPPGRPDALPAARRALVCGPFPSLEDPDAVAAARALSGAVIDAAARPVRVDRPAARDLAIAYAEDDGHLRRAGALLWLAVRRPVAVRRTGRAALALAPRARRLRRAGVAEVGAVAPAQESVARALAALAGTAYSTNLR